MKYFQVNNFTVKNKKIDKSVARFLSGFNSALHFSVSNATSDDI